MKKAPGLSCVLMQVCRKYRLVSRLAPKPHYPRHPSRTENQSKTNLESISHTGTSASQTDFTLTQTRTRSHCNARPTYTQHTLMKLIHTHTLNPLRDRFSCTGARVRYQAQ